MEGRSGTFSCRAKSLRTMHLPEAAPQLPELPAAASQKEWFSQRNARPYSRSPKLMATQTLPCSEGQTTTAAPFLVFGGVTCARHCILLGRPCPKQNRPETETASCLQCQLQHQLLCVSEDPKPYIQTLWVVAYFFILHQTKNICHVTLHCTIYFLT